MTKSDLQNQIKQKSVDLENAKKDYQQSIDRLTNNFLNTQAQLESLKTQMLNYNGTYPEFNDDLQTDIINDPSQMQANLQIEVQKAMWGSSTTGDNNFSLRIYLFVLERAQMIKSSVIFYGSSNSTLRSLYQVLYYGALNGKCGLIKKDNHYIPVSIVSKECDTYGLPKSYVIRTFNYSNSQNFESKEMKVKSNEIAVYQLNDMEFGLWILCWPYLIKINKFINLLNSQVNLKTKKMVADDEDNNPMKRKEVVSSITSNTPLIFTKVGANLRPLELPETNLQDFFDLIENYLSFFDFHFANMDSKDVENGKARDIASQQLNHQAQINKKQIYQTGFVEEFIEQFNTKFLEDVGFEVVNQDIIKDIEDQSINPNVDHEGTENYDAEK